MRENRIRTVWAAGKQLYFGVLLGGTGKIWVDDLECIVDGIPLVNVSTAIERDHESTAARAS